MSDTHSKSLLRRLNGNPLIRLGGGLLSIVTFIASVLAGVWTTIDPKYLVGAGVLALAFLLLLFVGHVLKGQRDPETGDYLRSLSETPEAVNLGPVTHRDLDALKDLSNHKPHIVVTSDHFMDAANYDQKCFRRSFGKDLEHTHDVFYIQLENTPNPPKGVGSPINVCARLTYTSIAHGFTLSNTPINYASWLGHDSPFIDFPLNTPRYLMIGAMKHDPDNGRKYGINMWGYDPDSLSRVKSFVQVGGPSWAFKVGVDLVIGEHAEWTHRFQFEFAMSERGWSLNQIKRRPPRLVVKKPNWMDE